MTKAKVERNISALDYLYKKLNWLVNKIETSSGGKVSKRDLIVYICIGIFLVSVYFGKVIGGFTFALVLVTIWNVRITQGLLRRSEKAFEQSRITSLIDITDRTINYIEALPEHNKTAKETSYIINKARAIKRISTEVSVEFGEAMTDWTEGKLEELKEMVKKDKEELKQERKNWANFATGFLPWAR